MENVEAETCFIFFSLSSLLSPVLFSAPFPLMEVRECDCTVAVLVTDVLYVQSEATLGNSLLCVSRSPRAKCYTG